MSCLVLHAVRLFINVFIFKKAYNNYLFLINIKNKQ